MSYGLVFWRRCWQFRDQGGLVLAGCVEEFRKSMRHSNTAAEMDPGTFKITRELFELVLKDSEAWPHGRRNQQRNIVSLGGQSDCGQLYNTHK
eukprot:4552639-Amphidinium_carterae.1